MCRKNFSQNLWNVSSPKMRKFCVNFPFDWMEYADVIMDPYDDVPCTMLHRCAHQLHHHPVIRISCTIYVNACTRFGPNATGDFILKPFTTHTHSNERTEKKVHTQNLYIFDERIKWLNDTVCVWVWVWLVHIFGVSHAGSWLLHWSARTQSYGSEKTIYLLVSTSILIIIISLWPMHGVADEWVIASVCGCGCECDKRQFSFGRHLIT